MVETLQWLSAQQAQALPQIFVDHSLDNTVSFSSCSPGSEHISHFFNLTVYMDTGTSSTNAGTFTITTSIATTGRTYKVKVNYIECSNLLRYMYDTT